MKTQHRYSQSQGKYKDKEILEQRADKTAESVSGGVVIGKLVDFSSAGVPLIAYDLSSSQEPIPAMSVVPLMDGQVGAEVVLSFASNRQSQPVIMGIVQQHFQPEKESQKEELAAKPEETTPELTINGEKINISAAKEIKLSCGKSSITLTEKGKILIKGEHILSRASGANRVRGGSIQLN